MKFVTPPTASAPYTAEAPPVIVSTRWTSAEGIELTSVTIRALIGTVRLPLTSTRLRFGPKPRSEIDAIPTELTGVICTSPCEVVGDAAGLYSGSWFR